MATPSLDDLRIERRAETTRVVGGRWAIAGLLTLAAAGAAAWWLFVRDRPIEVQVAAAQESAGPGQVAGAVLNASGYVTARRRATVSSKITGRIVDVRVEEGMAVREGQVLARLDDSLARAALQLAESQLAAARRAVTENEVRLNEARINLGRTQQLVKDGVATRASLDTSQAEVESQAARVDLAREQVTVAERQAALRRTELDDTVIRAPFSGVAISKDAQPGEMVSPVSAGGGFTRTGICTIVDMSSLEVEVDVNESYINRVATGQAVTATLDAYPDWQIPAHVITTVPSADRQKATVLVRIAFEKLDPRILPDMGVKVAFHGEERGGAATPRARLTIPRAAVRKEENRDVVFVVKDDRVERRAVRVGIAEGDGVEVLSGLTSGERVVVNPPAELRDGGVVRIGE
jgi:RND family efflux transporter MFP subunit